VLAQRELTAVAPSAMIQKPCRRGADFCFDAIVSSEVASTATSAGALPAQLGTVRAGREMPLRTQSRAVYGLREPGAPSRAEHVRSSAVGLWRTQLFSCVRSSCASRTDASISTRLIETLSTLIPNGTPSVRQ